MMSLLRTRLFTSRGFSALAGLLLFSTAVAQQNPAGKEDDRPVEDAAKFKLDKKAKPSLPTVYLVGDSTVRVGTAGQRGWGDELAPYFDLAKVNVVNHAIGGRSSRTFITEGRWGASLAQMQKGDFVLIQFGHNDSGPLSEPPPITKSTRARGTIKGIGDESEEVDNILTKKREVVHTYGWYIRQYIRDAKAKGVTPVVCSLIPRKSWGKDGKTHNRSGPGGYGGWALEVAAQEGALCIDLNDIIATGYEKVGKTKVEGFFADAGTHTTIEGAQFNARAVVSGLKALPATPFAPFLSAKAKDVAPFTPASKK